MKNSILTSALLLWSLGVNSAFATNEMATNLEQAQTLQSKQFNDQWDKPVELTEQTKWLVISQSKESGNIVKEAFESLELKDLKQYKMIYLADISAMPSFVTKLFALPKMRDYAFPMALIREEGELNAMQLPVKEPDSVTVLALDKLNVGETKYFSDSKSLTEFLKSVM